MLQLRPHVEQITVSSADRFNINDLADFLRREEVKLGVGRVHQRCYRQCERRKSDKHLPALLRQKHCCNRAQAQSERKEDRFGVISYTACESKKSAFACAVSL